MERMRRNTTRRKRAGQPYHTLGRNSIQGNEKEAEEKIVNAMDGIFGRERNDD